MHSESSKVLHTNRAWSVDGCWILSWWHTHQDWGCGFPPDDQGTARSQDAGWEWTFWRCRLVVPGAEGHGWTSGPAALWSLDTWRASWVLRRSVLSVWRRTPTLPVRDLFHSTLIDSNIELWWYVSIVNFLELNEFTAANRGRIAGILTVDIVWAKALELSEWSGKYWWKQWLCPLLFYTTREKHATIPCCLICLALHLKIIICAIN